MPRAFAYSPLRRSILKKAPLALALSSFSLCAMAQDQEDEPDLALSAQPFSFDWLSEKMKAEAAHPYTPPEPLDGFAANLDYDGYRLIQFRPEKARWHEEKSLFRLHAFHEGWLYKEPVTLFEVIDGKAHPMMFTTDDFQYRGPLEQKVEPQTPLGGVAGFRVNYPLNRADWFDELLAFVGASYFRVLGRGNSYGLSARGLAINTGLSGAEEFPRFSEFYLVKPAPGDTHLTIFAALESQSVTGAYRFEVHPGKTTAMQVMARLFFRKDITQLGVAPLTSMFLFSENNRARFDDYREQVHDSDGLKIVRENGDALWRPLNNPPRLARSYFKERSPMSFGLHQRGRDCENYQDAGAHYEKRPSVDVTPLGDWGEGTIELVEIPSDVEVNDNIVAFWVPSSQPKAGEMREYSYRLDWGDLSPQPDQELAYILETRAGSGGVSGVANEKGLRKFVIDFAGGPIAKLDRDAELEPVVSVSTGKVEHIALSKLPDDDIWRLVLDIDAQNEPLIEMRAHLAGFGRTLTQIWLYQWMRP